ncbi:TrkA C-terminal domain-containing protein [Desulforamulus hydrothermalis]|uniref:Transcriptional regulator, GntR family n=1 Tax=Desulforamulus hydrothermalis Lam5 = DSM 18033 TaxID=1121428 RepID=K8EDX9_9FIRM|nr:TrkA C-terminal domain-containing protein [Desulforamulus hydrothermalis]CCO07006.1 Transcriptional regulator, GntR family [Desulforamulus hydrothermalis Lam5 = DSM 18033]SHG97779.1 TrkA-C domain-containing protein [Desulforamulus hydrothermalis Lam5 = DSM 18033]
MSNNEVHVARYLTIAADLADRIVRGEYPEGHKIFGRSTLAGKYNVSPETIRRALTLLQEAGIVEVAAGVGVVVKSVAAAGKYLDDFDQRQALVSIHERLHQLVKERDRLNHEISRLTEELMEHTLLLETKLYKIEDWKVVPDSPLVGQTLSQSKLCNQKVLAIQRVGQEDILDPKPDSVIQAGDILTIYGRLDPALRQGLIRV